VSVFYLSCAILFTALAQTLYKLYSLKHKVVYLLFTVIFFCITPLMSYLALRELTLTVVYMSTAITYVLVMFSAKYILDEVIEKRHLYAVALIISGVLVFNI
jgi:multidrug transporter EmrE-like cation transporter